jgi:hypothetical protein
MPLEVQPPLPEAERRALRDALARSGIRIDSVSEAFTAAWFRAAVREAVDRSPAAGRYAPSPRRTRGATRA